MIYGQIVSIPLKKINLWKDNPRHNEHAVTKLAKILQCRGQVTPLVVWDKDMTVYKGNTTLKALRWLQVNWRALDKNKGENAELFNQLKLGLCKIIYYNFPNHVSAVAYGIADNKASEFATFDEDQLDKLMTLDIVGYPESLGYTEAEIANIKQNKLQTGLDEMPGEYDAESDYLTIKISEVARSHKEYVLEVINNALRDAGLTEEGYNYEAIAY